MSNATLSNVIRYGFRISHSEEGWITPLADAVDRLEPDAARFKPAPEVASAWELTAHASRIPNRC